MNTKILEDIGLTKNEITTFLELYKLGKASAQEIKEKTNLHNSVTYNALDRLIKQGLVSYILIGKRKIYQPATPEQIKRFAEDKKEDIIKLAEDLKTLPQPEAEQEAQLYEGWKGVKTAFNAILEILPEGEEYLAFGVGVEEQFDEEAKEFFKKFQKRRAEKEYKVKILLNEDARKQIKQIHYPKAFGTPQFKYVEGFAPIGIIIFKDYVLHSAFGPTPVAVLIKSKLISESQRRAFNSMWKIAKK